MTNAQALLRVENKVKRAQELLGVSADGWPGKNTEARYKELRTAARLDPDGEWLAESEEHRVMASSFADPADVRAFERCKAGGNTDKYCFAYGDNGIGCWGDNTAQTETAMVAIPPDDMIARWGSIDAAKHKVIFVSANNRTVRTILADRMPWRKNINNYAGCDLNPATCKALGLTPPVMVPAIWRWG